MKSPTVMVSFLVALATFKIGRAFFLAAPLPTASARCARSGLPPEAHDSTPHSASCRRTVSSATIVSSGRTGRKGRWGSRSGELRAAKEDCKSCMEMELLEEEQRLLRKQDRKTEEDEQALQRKRDALKEANRREKMRNVKIAVGSFMSSVALFFLQHSVIAPAQANPVVLLRAMESSSSPLATALTNGRPTVVDFYADWCENCKAMAPSMQQIEEQFKNQINFVVIDGSAEKNYDLVDAFRVDGIPHLAMVNSKGDVETAIVGAVPKEVIVDDIKALLANKELPYKGFDMFEGENHNIVGQVQIDG